MTLSLLGADPTSKPAPESHDAKILSQTLFDAAMALRKKGEHAESCLKFEESLRLDPAPGTKFYLAECLEQIGKLASAWSLYREVADEMASGGQKKRETFARERATALAEKLPTITILVPDALKTAGAKIWRNQIPVGEAQWGVKLPVDIGEHLIFVTAQDRPPFSKTVIVKEPSESLTIVIPTLLPIAAQTSTSAATASPTPRLITTSIPISQSPAPMMLAGYTLAGLGVLGLGLGGGFGGLALSKKDASNNGPCNAATDVCSAQGLSLREDALTWATASTVTFAVSGAFALAGMTLLVLPLTGAFKTKVAVSPNAMTISGNW